MAKKVKRSPKPGPDSGARWTVRGVAVPLQRSASEAARAEGKTLGQWLSEVVEAALKAAPQRLPAPDWREAVEARLARLEGVVGVDVNTTAGEPASVVAN